jgi:hypothetical protein
MARTPQRCSSPSLSNSNKATKAIGGIREEEQRGEHKILQDLDPKDLLTKRFGLVKVWIVGDMPKRQ